MTHKITCRKQAPIIIYYQKQAPNTADNPHDPNSTSSISKAHAAVKHIRQHDPNSTKALQKGTWRAACETPPRQLDSPSHPKPSPNTAPNRCVTLPFKRSVPQIQRTAQDMPVEGFSHASKIHARLRHFAHASPAFSCRGSADTYRIS